MNQQKTDIAVIGAGTAGLAAYRAAKAHTPNVLLIEGGPYGTTCARVGCMPSKLLIAAAEAAHVHQRSSLFGVDYPAPTIRGEAVLTRVRNERDRFAGFVVDSVNNLPEEDKIKGYARFLDNHRLQVNDDLVIEAERIVIASGSRPKMLPLFEVAGDRLLINDDVFELEQLPKRIVLFGPGVIGLELGQALSRLGVEITMFGHGGALGILSHPEVRDYAINHFSKEFYVDVDAKIENIERIDDQVEVRFEHREKGVISERFDYLLATIGRQPNVDKLGLENTSLELDARGIPVCDHFTQQCGDSHIFLAGDANDFRPLLHEAADEGKTAGDNAARFPHVLAGMRRTPLGVVFTEPQIATVGLNLPLVKVRCQQYFATGSVSFEDQGRSRCMGINHGMLKVYGEQGSGLLLGAEMFGPAAEHIGHLLSWAIQKRMTVSEILDLPFYHPVIEEGVRTALRDLNERLHIGPEFEPGSLDCGPGG